MTTMEEKALNLQNLIEGSINEIENNYMELEQWNLVKDQYLTTFKIPMIGAKQEAVIDSPELFLEFLKLLRQNVGIFIWAFVYGTDP